MLALMLYAESRRAARRDAAGAYVPLEQQDTSLWDDSQIRLAETLLRDANQAGPTGRYQLEAAIQSAHTARRLAGVDNWPAIVALYDHLLARTHSPVVVLNRAVALAELDGPAAALASHRARSPTTSACRPTSPTGPPSATSAAAPATSEAAIEALTIAIGLTTDPAVRTYLHGRIAALRRLLHAAPAHRRPAADAPSRREWQQEVPTP